MAPAQAARVSDAQALVCDRWTMKVQRAVMYTVYACFQRLSSMCGIRNPVLGALGRDEMECWERGSADRRFEARLRHDVWGRSRDRPCQLLTLDAQPTHLCQQDSHGPVACDPLAKLTRHTNCCLRHLHSHHRHPHVAANSGDWVAPRPWTTSASR